MAGDELDIESTDLYVHKPERSPVNLEPPEQYVRHVKAQIRLSKARAANWIAMILVIGLVASLPVYVIAVACFPKMPGEIGEVFGKWYDVVGPLLGAVIGALFGMSIASRDREVLD